MNIILVVFFNVIRIIKMNKLIVVYLYNLLMNINDLLFYIII